MHLPSKQPLDHGRPPERQFLLRLHARPRPWAALKKNHQETTTTPRAHAKEALPVSEEPPSSLFCAVASPREEVLDAGHLTEADRQWLDQIAEEFGLDSRQQVKTQALAKRQGIGYVLEQADIVRNKPGIKNLAGALERALDTPGGWKRPKRAPKAERKAKALAQPKSLAEPEEDFSAELKLWQQASPAQREAWFADPAFRVMRMPRDGQSPSKMFLQILRFVVEQHKEAAAA